MKTQDEPLTTRKSKMTRRQKSSGVTPSKLRAKVAKFSRKDKDIPGDRGNYEKESATQGGE